jgi:hypothetical protein
MKLLFLTDLHMKSRNEGSQRSALGELVRAVEGLAIPRFDAVILGGDIAYSGRREEYDAAFEAVVRPLRALECVGKAPWLAVPGNHDMDCEVGNAVRYSNLAQRQRECYFDDSESGRRARAQRASAFSEFESFLERAEIRGPRPSREVTVLEVLTADNVSVAFLLTNTAFFCDSDSNWVMQGALGAPTPSIRVLGDGLAPSKKVIVVGHHPHSWFEYTGRRLFRSWLGQNSATYLHGHEHEFAAEMHGSGLECFGFGAGYVRSPDNSEGEQTYTNRIAAISVSNGLHFKFLSWSARYGHWHEDCDVPHQIGRSSPDPLFTHFVPEGGPASKDTTSLRVQVAAVAKPPTVSKSFLVGDLTPARIRSLSRAYFHTDVLSPADLHVDASDRQQATVTVDRPSGRHKTRLCLAPSHVVTRHLVEQASNDFDYEALDRLTLVTFGTITADAISAQSRLATRKDFSLVDGGRLAELVLGRSTDGLRAALARLDGRRDTAKLLVHEQGEFFLIEDLQGERWFYLIDGFGEILLEPNPVVGAVREGHLVSMYARYDYSGIAEVSQNSVETGVEVFDRGAYLDQCAIKYGAVQYSALAAMGLRPSDLALTEIFVETGAEGGEADPTLMRYRQAIGEAMEGLPDGAGTAPVVEFLQRRMDAFGSGTRMAARRYYQDSWRLLVVGDPGSGKTMFVKNEFLAYCRPPAIEPEWYEARLPVYVSLADLVRFDDLRSEKEDILPAICRYVARQGFELPEVVLRSFGEKGLLAVFFDGLDEIVSAGDRASVLKKLEQFLLDAQKFGNRVIITSRPAAVDGIDLPRNLERITLQGLTIPEMRELASNVLRLRGGERTGMTISQEISPASRSLVERIMDDCTSVPGIGRMARNPLLLTLLVMVYANSGAPAAKRHRIYAQAIRTLVSVRSREKGHRQYSDADLRLRLGSVAFDMFSDSSAVVPQWDSAIRNIETKMNSSRNDAVSFVRDVANSTGIILVHTAPPRVSGGSVENHLAFMHHSFAEFYAAAYLRLTYSPGEVASVFAGSARWAEVLPLYAGILADDSDVTPFIVAILNGSQPIDRITAASLLLAISLAGEGEVPPEAAVAAILNQFRLLAAGSLGADLVLCGEVCEPLARTLVLMAPSIVAPSIFAGLQDQDLRRVRAFIVLGSYLVAERWDSAAGFAKALDGLVDRAPSDIDEALCVAFGVGRDLEGEKVGRCLARSLTRAGTRHSALGTLERRPELVGVVWDELIDAVGDADPNVAARAARIVLRTRLALGAGNRRQVVDLTRAVECVTRRAPPGRLAGLGVHSDLETVTSMITSPDTAVRKLGILLLPVVEGHASEVHQTLVSTICSPSSDEDVVAALASLRMSVQSSHLFHVWEFERVAELLNAGRRDIRLAAARLLADLRPSMDELSSVQDYISSFCSSDPEEWVAGLDVIAAASGPPEDIEKLLELHLKPVLAAAVEGRGRIPIVHGALGVVTTFSWTLENTIHRSVWRLAKQVRGNEDTPRIALAAFGHCCPLDGHSATLLAEALLTPGPTFASAALASASTYLDRCRRLFWQVRGIEAEVGVIEASLLRVSGPVYSVGRMRHSADLHHLRRAFESIRALRQMYESVAGSARRQLTATQPPLAE